MKHSSSTTRALSVAAALSSRPSRRRLRGWCARLLCLLVCCGPMLQSGLFSTPGRAHGPAGGEAKAAAAANAGAARAAGRRGGRVAGEVLVRFRDGASGQEAGALFESRGLRRRERLRGPSGVERVAVADGMDAETVARELSANPAVEFAEPNYVITADQYVPRVPSFPGPRSPQAASLFGPRANAMSNTSRAGVTQLTSSASRAVVAVIDSGVDFTHRELTAYRWTNRSEKANGVDDGADGYADDFAGWDFVRGSNQSADESGHGTAVAGLIVAQGRDEQGRTWRPRLMSLRVLDAGGSGDVAAAVEAIDYAVAHGAHVINCSWGTDAPSLALKAAVERAARRDVLVVSAAGNNGKDLDDAPRYPAAWQLPQTLSVAAVGNSLLLARWSNWGASSVSVAAPGEEVRSAKAGGAHAPVSGTSASAASVAGLAGLLRARRPGLSAAQTRELITGSVRRLAGLYGKVATGGVVDRDAALGALDALPPSETPEKKGDDEDAAGEPERTGNARAKKGTLGNVADAATGGANSALMKSAVGSASAQSSNLPDLNAAKQRPNAGPRVLAPVPSKRPRYRHREQSCCDGKDKAPSAVPAPTPGAMPAPAVRPRASVERPSESRWAALSTKALAADIVAALGGRPPDFDLAESDYFASGGGFSVSDNWAGLTPLALAPAPPPDAPASLSVTAASSTQISMTWVASPGATSYRVERSPSASGLFSLVGTTSALTFSDTGVTSGSAYLYRIRAVSGAATSPTSNLALGTAITFTDPTLVAQVTPVKAQHVYDLREAVNAVRRAADLADAAWTDATLTGGVHVKAVHIQQLRDRLNEALSALDIPVTPFTDPTLSTGAAGTAVKKVHFDELRLRSTRGASAGTLGGGSGLTSRYYNNLDFTDFKFGRVDPTVNFNWGDGPPDPSFGPDQFSVRWLGFVQARHSQTYTFYSTSDDGIRVWVNGQLVIDNWTDHPLTENSGTVTLAAGVLTPIKVEFYENFGGAMARLEWASASQPREVVPQGQLYPCWKDVNDFVTTFYQNGLGRQPSAAELQDWRDALMQAQGETQLVLAAASIGRAIFTSQEYAARNPSDNQLYVADLYRSFLQREPDQAGLNFWTQQTNLNGRLAVLEGFEGSPEFNEKSRRLCDLTATGYNFSTSRLDPVNRTGGAGVDPLSRNFNWTLPVVSLPGRAGHDLGLVLSYNSLVWTRDGGGITYDADRGSPSPGFRLGFPTVEPRFFDPATGKDTFLLITATGARVGLRRVGASNVFEAADSSYLQLTDNGPSLTLVRTDGARLALALSNGEYRTTEIKDRNGNTISASYDGGGQLASVVDTLGRTLTFNYDQFGNLISITQPWRREGEAGQTVDETHTWASFGYADVTLQPAFNNLTVIGAQPGTVIPVVRRVGLGDGSYYRFDYNQWGQVWKVTHFAADSVVNGVAQDTHALSATRYNLPGSDLTAATAQDDCPRFTEERLWVENGVMNQTAEVTTGFTPWSPHLTFCNVTVPDGTVYKDIYGSGWRKGLTVEAHVYSADNLSVPKKRSVVTWTQDDENLPYQQNPRVAEANIYDEANNRSRTTFTYDSFGLPRDVTEYAADASTPLRTTRTDYNLAQVYLDRRIIGLPAFQYVYAGTPASGALSSKVEYVYDDTSDATFMQALPAPAAGHDAGYGATFRTRGHVNRVRRYDVTGAASSFVETRIGYNAAGAAVLIRDPEGHQTNIGYADSFYQGVNRDAAGRPTYAFPTAVTDPGNFSSTVVYNYDLGEVTRTSDPKGAVVRTRYDGAGRVERISRYDGATEKGYTRQTYPLDMRLVNRYTLFDDGQAEFYTASVLDGVGRVRATAHSHPGSTGGYSGQFFDFNTMGRLARQSNPTETTAAGAWPATGDDATVGWLYRQFSYDWQGRLRLTTNTDDTTREVNYTGCGCAGGAVATVTDEVGRRHRVSFDSLGRNYKAEVLNPDGSTYRAIVSTYNARDQVTRIRDFAGADPGNDSCPTGTCQETLFGYDGHGRLASRKKPIESAPSTFLYNDDDTVQRVTDSRGAAANYGYNSRHLATGITYDAPAGVQGAAAVGFEYDSAGNRVLMTDGLGQVDYAYDTLSRMTSETRHINGVGSFGLGYSYNHADEVKSVTDTNNNHQINYGYDHAGRVSEVTGTPYGGVSTYASGMQYRAWGAIKRQTYGNNLVMTLAYNARLLPQRFEVNNRPSQFGPSTVMLSQFSYYADGRLRFADDGLDDRFDRAHAYDHAGRLKEAYTGGEAHNFINNTTGGLADGPYRQSYQYDAWDNITLRDTRFWSQQITFTATYVNNRNQNPLWIYDAAGNLTRDDDIQYTFDAAGRNRQAQSLDGSRTNNSWHDGDGRVVKREELRSNGFPAVSVSYLVRSSVLGGRVVTEVNAQGAKQKGYVYARDELLAEQANNVVTWRHVNPLTGSQGESSANGNFWVAHEADPAGINVGVEDPFVFPDPGGFIPEPELPMLFPLGDGGGCSGANPNCTTCYLDGFQIGCDQAFRMLENGSALPEALARYQHVPGFRFESLGLGLFRYYVPGQNRHDPNLGPPGGNSTTVDGDDDEVVRVTTNVPNGWRLLYFPVTQQTQTAQVINHSKILNDSIERVKKKLTGDCLKLFDKFDPVNYLANHVSIGETNASGDAFVSELNMANTLSDADSKGVRQASGNTVFNQNSTFFSGTFNGKPLSLKPESSMYGLSLDQIRDLAVLHELFHINDTAGKYDDATNDPKKNLDNTKAINKLLREKCGFPTN